MAGTVNPKQFDHVGIAVKDFDAMVKFMKDTYGVEPRLREQPEIGIRGAMFQFGQAKLEIVSPTKEGTAVAKFLDTRGPGLHHIAFRVDSVKGALDSLKAKGVQLVDQAPRAGMFGTVGFAHPSSMQGILTEFVQDFLPEHQPK
jgi:methylmalonyl-CoA/ethylmalonyl-CoA epimerase